MPLLKPFYPIVENVTLTEDMTLIVAGKLNKRAFLMIDCVGFSSLGHSFHNKLQRFRYNPNIFYAVAGSENFMRAIDIYDTDCYNKNTSIDFDNDVFVNEVLDIFKMLSMRPEVGGTGLNKDGFNRIYIIEEYSIQYFDIQFDENHTNPTYKNTTINDNHFISALYAKGIPKPFENSGFDENDIYNSCLSSIRSAAKLDYPDKFDLKGRWSFISFEENKIDFRVPYKNNREHILAYVGAKYSEL